MKMFTSTELRNLRKVRAFIAKLRPAKIKMSVFAEHNDRPVEGEGPFNKKHFQAVGCGTAGCMAGWGAVALRCLNQSIVCDVLRNERFDSSVMEKKLGLRKINEGNIFSGYWPTAIVQKHSLVSYPTANGPHVSLNHFDHRPGKVRKAVLLDVLDYLILTGHEPERVKLPGGGVDDVILM